MEIERMTKTQLDSTLNHVQRVLTGREFEGYLKGKIIELRYKLSADMDIAMLKGFLGESHYYEKILMGREIKREAKACTGDKTG